MLYYGLLCMIILGHSVIITAASPVSESSTMDLRMPGIRPPVEDYYACTSFPVEKEEFVTQYAALADAGTAHHILLYGCSEPASDARVWKCGSTCKGMPTILYAWAKNANPTKLPPDVGFHIGGDSNVHSLVLQVHYARVVPEGEDADTSGIRITKTANRPRFTQGILLLVSGSGSIPPKQKKVNVDISCRFSGKSTIYPFAFRTHAHALSYAISGYKLNKTLGDWELLGKGNPQWPQAFYPMESPHSISPGDMLVGRCMYDSSLREKTTQMGETHMDEMCNFYMMYYMDGEAQFEECLDNQFPQIANTIPEASKEHLPPNEKLDMKAMGHHNHGMHESADDGTAIEVDEPEPSSANDKPMNVKVDDHPLPYVTEAEKWFTMPADVKMVSIAGADVDSDGRVHIFHRGDHIWDGTTFDLSDDTYLKKDEGPVSMAALVVLDDSSRLADKWGENMFYMPHGITIDHDDNVWLTDVAMHQVFKFPKGEKQNASLTLGEAFVPGKDEDHFCKPTDVAVRSDGSFYVADGYCNSRIVMFSPEGEVIRQIGSYGIGTHAADNKFFVPHSLGISEAINRLCVADRENERIQCYDLELNHKLTSGQDEKVFAIAFRPNSDKLLGVLSDQSERTGHGIILDIHDDGDKKLGEFNPAKEDFGFLHDLAVTKDGQSVYVVQMYPAHIWKFGINVKDDADKKLVENLELIKKKTTLPLVRALTEENPSGSETIEPNNKVPTIVAVLLLVPIACVLIILLGFKIYTYKKNKRRGVGFDMGNMFGSKPKDTSGFSPLTAQEDVYTDSEEDDSLLEKKSIMTTKH